MKLTQLVVRRPVSAIIVIAAIVIFGVMAIVGMPQELMAEMEFPMHIIYTIYGGASPEDIEKLVSQEIEGSVGSLSGVKTVTSQSTENISIVMIQYEYGTNMDTAYTDLKERLDQLQNTLPDDASNPTVMEMDMNAMASIYLSVSSDKKQDLLYHVEEEIVPELQKLSSVADVSVSGGREDYIRVELMEDRMQQYGVSMSTVVGSVSTADFSMPLGNADFGSQELPVRSEVKYNSLSALQNIPVPIAGGTIRLSDVANVYMASKDASSISRYNGQENISLSIQKRQSASAVTLSRDVTKVIQQLVAEDPDVTISVVNDTSDTISSAVSSVASTLILGIVISMIVLYVFLGDLRVSLIVGSSMPVSLLITFIFMNFMGFTLNVVSLAGLVIGVGMMVDNSIVVLDSCFKNRSKDRTFAESAIEGTRFVMLSIAAGTVTTVVVFLPLALMEGLSGQMFAPLAFTIVFSLIASLVSAITLVPLFFSQFQPEERRRAPAALFLKRVERAYGNLLRRLLRRKVLVFLTAMALLAVSLVCAFQLDMELMSSIDEGVVQISVETRPGLKLERIDEIVTGLEQMVAQHDEVEHYTLSAGGSSWMGSANTITAYLDSDRKMKTDDVVEMWRQRTKDVVDCDISIENSSMTMSSISSDDVQINLKGNDLDVVKEAADLVQGVMMQNPGIIRTTTSVADTSPQAEIVVDAMKAANVGMLPSQVSGSVYTALNGTESVSVRMNDQNYSIWVEYPEGRYNTISDIENMNIVTATGATVPLREIASVEMADSPQTIVREDNQYIVTVSGTPTQAAKYSAGSEVYAAVQKMDLPNGVGLYEGSYQEMMMEELGALFQAILIAVLLVFMVMAIQFESIRHSLMVMVCIPFSLIGSFGFLFITRTTLSMVSVLGFLILVGTVVNNGILFVDTTNQYRKSMDLHAALVSTGRTRLRPILMTTLTTVLSMVPLAIGMGSGAEMMKGMGIVVIGGLTASTILTLLLLPTFYLMIDGNAQRRAQRKQRRLEKREARKEKVISKHGEGPVDLEKKDDSDKI